MACDAAKLTCSGCVTLLIAAVVKKRLQQQQQYCVTCNARRFTHKHTHSQTHAHTNTCFCSAASASAMCQRARRSCRRVRYVRQQLHPMYIHAMSFACVLELLNAVQFIDE